MVSIKRQTSAGEFYIQSSRGLNTLGASYLVINSDASIQLAFDDDGNFVLGDTSAVLNSMDDITAMVKDALQNDDMFKFAVQNEKVLEEHLILIKNISFYEDKLKRDREALSILENNARTGNGNLVEQLEAQVQSFRRINNLDS